MIFYYIYIAIALFCIHREHQNLSEKQRRWNLGLSLLPVFSLMAFKGHTVGSDTPNYLYQFKIIEDEAYYQELYERIEPGYDLMQKILHSITADPLILLITVALVTCISCYYFFRDNCKYCCTALYFFMALGYFPFIMSGIRQTIAMSICMLAFRFVKEKKLYKFIALILLAMSFHKSAIFFVPAYFLAYQKMKRNRLIMQYGGLLIIFFFAERILMTAEDLVGYNYGVEETGNGQLFFALVLFITYMAVKRRHILILANELNSIHLNINFLSLAMWTVRLVSRTAERVALYFMPYTMIVLTDSIETMDKSKRTIFRLLFLFVATYLLLHRIGVQEDLNQYKFFFQ